MIERNVETIRRMLIARLERYAKLAREYFDRGEPLPENDKRFLFNALADAGDFNRKYPERAIPPLDRELCRVQEPRFSN